MSLLCEKLQGTELVLEKHLVCWHRVSRDEGAPSGDIPETHRKVSTPKAGIPFGVVP